MPGSSGRATSPKFVLEDDHLYNVAFLFRRDGTIETDERYGYLRVRHCAQARCIENHVYTAIAGCVGNLPFVDNADIHYAQSGIYTPSDLAFSRDAIASECSPNIETVLFHDVDLKLLSRHKHAGTVQNWKDRRTDVYRLLYREGDQEFEAR